jgi:glycosyltransferase involved in cell wall biosynthesis
VEVVYDPLNEVDKIYEACRSVGQPCVFLHFSGPHNFFSDIKCPTIHVFAWEYDTIPHEPWDGDGYKDWRAAFSCSVGAISISEYSAESVRKEMGDGYPALSMPCPIWDGMEYLRGAPEIANPQKSTSIHFDGVLIDSRVMDLRVELPSKYALEEEKRRGDTRMLVLAEKNARIQDLERQLLTQKTEQAEEIGSEWRRLNEQWDRFEETVRGPREKLRTVRGRMSLIKTALKYFLCALKHALSGPYLTSKPETEAGLKTNPERARRAKSTWRPEKIDRQIKAAEEQAAQARAEIDKAEAQNEFLNMDDEFKDEPTPTDAVVSNAVYLDGVVYSAMVNPYDSRKNWQDMVIAFCWAFKDVDDATLVIKLSAIHIVEFGDELTYYLKRLAPFKCRIVAIYAYLEKTQYERLLKATTYFVNTSYGEGQSIPLCEAMSAGIPGVAPNHTAMRDYVFQNNSFIFKSHLEPTHWQHDPRRAYRCLHYKPDWSDLVTAYRKSYELAKTNPDKYREMGAHAIESQRADCSIELRTEKFGRFLNENMHAFFGQHAGR